MPRKTRIEAPCALHHIIVRGIERRKIFDDDNDRDDFLNRSAMRGRKIAVEERFKLLEWKKKSQRTPPQTWNNTVWP